MNDNVQIEEAFPMHRSWAEAFEALGSSLRRLPKVRRLEPSQLAALSKLIHAVDRLPLATEGIHAECSLSIDHRHSGAILSITLTECSFEFCVIERFDSGIGWDHETKQILYVEPGYSNRAGEDPFSVGSDLEVWVGEWNSWSCDEDVSLTISDEASEEFWDQEIDLDAWSRAVDG
jgi:hypothetical protein